MTEQVYQIAFSLLHGVGYKRATQLMAELGSPEAIFENTIQELANQSTFSKKFFQDMRRKVALEEASRIAQNLTKWGINTHFFMDSNYPRRLKQCPDAPILFYSKGEWEINPQRTVAIVGTRNETDYGRFLTQQFIADLKNAQVTVVSGLAYGIDILTHQQCLLHDIPTIAVLGSGIQKIYPHLHQHVAKRMQINGGLISEFKPYEKAEREHFPQRNRIVAGLCDATVIIESKKKGGSLITAQLANDYHREVFAFPGNIGNECSEGCNSLIKNHQAFLLHSAEDFLLAMGWDAQAKIPYQEIPSLEKDEQNVVDLLKENPEAHVDWLGFKMHLSPAEISFLLLTMEMKNYVETLPGKRYRLKMLSTAI